MRDIQEELKKIQQDNSKDDVKLESLDLDTMARLCISKKYNDKDSYCKPNHLDNIIPDCYKNIKFDDKKFDFYKEEILFYIFYTFPGEEIQKSVFNALIKKGYVYSKFYRCFVIYHGKKQADNSKEILSMFDPFNWNMIKREIMIDDKFISSLESTPLT